VLLRLGGARAAGLLVNTMVIHRPDDGAVRELAIEYRAYPVATRSADGELSDTLRAGVEAISGRETGQRRAALLICLGDQPLLRLEVIEALINSWRAGGLMAVRPSYRDSPGEPGHPLLIDHSLWGLARELRGDSGFAPMLAQRASAIKAIPVGGRNPDIDTPEDLVLLEAAASGSLL
jgi:CTP:molybdopterin cytidylyltransferase MocA